MRTSRKVLFNDRRQLFEGKWLGEVIVHSRRQAPLAVAVHGIGRQCNDGNRYGPMRALFLQTDGFCSRKAIHLRHLAIHENEIDRGVKGYSYGVMAVLD